MGYAREALEEAGGLEQFSRAIADDFAVSRAVLALLRPKGRLVAFDKDPEAIVEAAKSAHAHDFIMDLPDGYQSLVGERGVKLSGGQRQRVCIARALVNQPQMIIADEPTGNLDPKHAWDVIKVLEKINRFGTTVLLTTHNQDIVNRLKRRVITKNIAITVTRP